MATTTRDDVLARLDEGVAALANSARWTAWLRVQARFHRLVCRARRADRRT